MAKIVISYRRADSEALTGRLRDRLVGHYGNESIFMDIDSIPFGTDFRDYIKEVLEQTDLVLAVMGPRWVGTSATGAPARITEETDPVRIEVETALARGIAVIPVLIDNAAMPQPSELPETLRNLAYRNAAHVDSGRDFHLHMDRLIRAMDKIIPGAAISAAPGNEGFAQNLTQPYGTRTGVTQPVQAPAPKRKWGKWIAIAAAVPVVIFGILLAIGLYAPDVKRGAGTTTVTVTAPEVVQVQPSPPAQPAPPVVQPASPTPPPAPVQPAAVSPPATCGTATVFAFRDNFAPATAGWDDASQIRLFENGQMVFRFKDPGILTWLYRPMRFKNASICATVRAPMQANKLEGAASGGVVFWAADYSNYYLAQVYLDGTYQVYRRLSGEWIPVVQRAKSDHVRQGLGAINELQVTIKENAGTFYANGQKLVDFRGQPPKDGGAIGLHGESEADRGAEWRFLGIAAVDDEPVAPKPLSARAQRAADRTFSCQASSDTAFADDFKNPDAGWGETTQTAYYENGNFILKPQPNRTRTVLYQALRYRNATACVNMKWPTNDVQGEEIASGGLAFWGQNYKNFYEASLFRDGTFDIYRLIEDEWVAVVKRTASTAIKKGPDAINQLKVAIVDNKVSLFINDTKVSEIFGQPPRAGGAVGLFAQSDKERQNDWRFLSVAVVD
jgi:hypothetical protein